ncbi:MAG: 3-dehydroquinate synthase [Flavobacteriales bacterium]|nr:3-dehydroquinate synthase [Flavobacteriales bacterium]
MTTTGKDVEELWAGGHPVYLGAHVLPMLARWMEFEAPPEQCYVLGDSITLRQCLPELLTYVPHLQHAEPIEVAPGEASKSIDVCTAIWGHLSDREAERGALLVNLGGGVVSDLGGFIAGTYKRGIRHVNVPTSLMGMVDASIGGKTGIDAAGIKNLVGLFRDPLGVYVHVPFLRTLGKRELLNGVAEMIKHGLVRSADHYHAVREAPLHDIGVLAPLIHDSVAIKCAVVNDDPHEQGVRKLLNFGHTIGHAVEAHSWESQQRGLLHGEAVAIGMICEAWLSWRQGLLDRGSFDQIESHLIGLFKGYAFNNDDHHRMLELMRNDKKNAEGGFRFTLLRGIGDAVVNVPLNAAQVGEALDHYRLLVRHHAAHHDPEA